MAPTWKEEPMAPLSGVGSGWGARRGKNPQANPNVFLYILTPKGLIYNYPPICFPLFKP